MSSYTHKVELNDFRGAWTAFNRKITFELFEAYENMQVSESEIIDVFCLFFNKCKGPPTRIPRYIRCIDGLACSDIPL